jgi:predicted aspartyl protease
MRAYPGILAVLVLSAFAARASEHAEHAGVSPLPTGVIDELLVDAPEPSYVAPTLRDRIGRVWAPVYINGKGPFRLVLDTGANRTAITQPVADRIGAPLLASRARLIGVTGSAMVPVIHAERLEVGDLLLTEQKLAIVQDVFGGAHGVLGADGLGDKRVEIDFRNGLIAIKHARHKIRRFGYTRVPVQLLHGHLLIFNVKVAGVRAKAMLDTGAQVTIGNSTLREALERRNRRSSTYRIMGVTLVEQSGEALDAPPVTIRNLTINNMKVTFGDFHVFDAWELSERPALLIGMDVIGTLDALIIDYKHKELLMRPQRW